MFQYAYKHTFMKERIILFLFLLFELTANAQNNISVASFKLIENDLTATTHGTEVKDQNGNTCALIKVQTTQTGFTFDVGMMGVMKTEQHTGEIWVYVPFGVKHISIHHQQLGHLNDYYFPCSIEKGRTYRMELVSGKVEIVVNPEATQQWLVFNVSPKDALVWVNEEPWQVADGVAQKYVGFGTYDYRVEASNYHSTAGKINVNDPENTVKLDINLKPAFGFLKIEGDNTILSKASIYIDNANGTDALRTPRQLASGQHTVRIVHQKYKPFERKVNIEDEQTFTLNANLSANFSTVTLKVDADAEIWVNNEKKGTRTWTGDLEAGDYTIECRMKNHRTSMAKRTITDNMSGQVINLNAPTPIMGRLMVSSTPSLAKLFIDGEEVGETPKVINQILIGEHTVRIEKAGCAPVSRTVTIEEGKTFTLEEKLDTGRNLTVETDHAGDKVYIDREYVGETPLHTSVGFGSHTVKVVRDKNEQSKDIEVRTSDNDLQIFIAFGRLVTITTDQKGDVVFVDGEKVGISPVKADLAFGKHTIHAERGKKYADKDITVSRTGGETEHHLVLHSETPQSFVSRGVNFILLNGAYSIAPQTSFGLTLGQVKQFGWYASFMTNFNFIKPDMTCNANGDIGDNAPLVYSFTKKATSRWSFTAGGLCKLGNPVYLYAGLGYGQRTLLWKTDGGQWVAPTENTYKGFTFEAGLMAHIKGFSISAGATVIGTNYMECKMGVGYCFKRR